MNYPRLYGVRLLGEVKLIGAVVCFDKEYALELVSMKTGWPETGLEIIEANGNVSVTPLTLIVKL